MKATVPEFNRVVLLDELEDGEISRDIDASDDEREALAARFDLLAVDALGARLQLCRVPDGPLVRVEGRLVADVVQRCVVTLAPLPVHIEAEIAETFGPAGYRPAEAGDDGDEPEVFDDNGIDVGELAAQLLLLSLDPYPRAAGADRPELSSAEGHGGNRSRPFAALGDMMRRQRK